VAARMRRWHNPPMPSTFARKLRADATEAEIRLWSKLRRKQLDGFRFRRQQPMGDYIVDFFCPEADLIIEVDGGQHVDESPVRADWLARRGYRVMRFWNNEVLANTDGVLETILDALQASRTRRDPNKKKSPPPKNKSSPPLRGRV
jgi:very-short-patch-repair endonuclease